MGREGGKKSMHIEASLAAKKLRVQCKENILR
jgi:hypothetical protein